MDKKAKSKPMREIIRRLVSFGEFEVVSCGDQMGHLLGRQGRLEVRLVSLVVQWARVGAAIRLWVVHCESTVN